MYKRYLLAALLCLSAGPSPASATAAPAAASDGLTAVNSFSLFGQAHNWRALDRDTLIIWTSSSRPYLLELRRASPELRFADGIGITSTAGRVAAGFDDVIVDGWRYPIEAIYALDRDRAKALLSASRRSS